MTEPNRNRLADLKARLAEARAKERGAWEKRPGRTEMSGAGMALRVGIELAGSLAVGVGIGWALDRWLGTGPWLLVVFFFIGGAAGVLNVYRAVRNIGLAVGYKPPRGGEEDKNERGGGPREGPAGPDKTKGT